MTAGDKLVAARAWLRVPRDWRALLWLAPLAVTAGAAGMSALNWRSLRSAQTSCETNQRRLSTALLLYSQDHDGCLPPPAYEVPGGRWRPWTELLAPYIAQQSITTCPSNPARGARDPYHGYPFACSYALNLRFYGLLTRGPFPVENVEIPAQTALLVEGGYYRVSGPFGATSYPYALSWYWDTAWWPNVYPSPHARRMVVAAVDGHVSSVRVAHYRSADHDPWYGRLGGGIYNWNGGHPNDDTAGPPHE